MIWKKNQKEIDILDELLQGSLKKTDIGFI
jgi:hypothetical protein